MSKTTSRAELKGMVMGIEFGDKGESGRRLECDMPERVFEIGCH